MICLNKADTQGVGLAFRVSATAPYGARPSHKLLPNEVVDKHWAIADAMGQVAFSTNAAINLRAYPNVEKLYLFANSKNQQFLCETEIVQILPVGEEAYVPASVSDEIQVPEWRGEPKKTWMILKNFRQLDIETCEIELLNKPALLRDQMQVPRFRTCFVKLESSQGRQIDT